LSQTSLDTVDCDVLPNRPLVNLHDLTHRSHTPTNRTFVQERTRPVTDWDV
jgi:hypothetical protein